jgi:hypothetical protein
MQRPDAHGIPAFCVVFFQLKNISEKYGSRHRYPFMKQRSRLRSAGVFRDFSCGIAGFAASPENPDGAGLISGPEWCIGRPVPYRRCRRRETFRTAASDAFCAGNREKSGHTDAGQDLTVT